MKPQPHRSGRSQCAQGMTSDNVMLILELTNKECIEMLTRLRFGRVGCSPDNQSYVVPIHFAYHDGHLYSIAAPGQKIEWMRANPLVCVAADEIIVTTIG